MTWACKYGHQNAKDKRKPEIHNKKEDCEYWRAINVKPATSEAPPSMNSPPPATAEQKSAPAPQAPAKSGFLSIEKTPAATVASSQVPNAEDLHGLPWLLSESQTVDAWQVVFSGIELVFNTVLRALKCKELPPQLCNLRDGGAKALLITRNMRGTTTQAFIYFGVTTQEQAGTLISEGQGAVSFLGIFAGIAGHLMVELPKSPVLKEWWDKLEKDKAEGKWQWPDLSSVFGKKEPAKDADSKKLPQGVGA